ncbi:MAG: NRDE family protein [Oceanihabitans sp.]
MCTVSIFPIGENDFVLTSNRDEAPNRISLPPSFYSINATRMLFPKDEKAGGTWIGVSEKNRLICLLNGGFTKHKRQEVYKLSRGIIVTNLLSASNIVTAISNFDLNNIEPFTIVIADWNTQLQFYELVWDGTQKHFKELPKEARIWSSATLYTKSMKEERKLWFEIFKNNTLLNATNTLQFHKNTQKNNAEYGVIMDRGFVKTTSITQVVKTKNQISMRFENLDSNTVANTSFLIPKNIYEK